MSARRVWRKISAALVFCILVMLSVRAGMAPRIKILTSIFPFYEFAKAVCGERGEVEMLVPPGAEVHTWKPKPSDIIKLARADVFIGVGDVLEPWLNDIIRSVKNPDLFIIKAIEILPLEEETRESHEHSGEHVGIDPHVWLNIAYDIQVVKQLQVVLSQLDTQNAGLFQRNAEEYIKKLEKLDSKYQEALADCRTRIIIVGGHSAFGYLAKRYNLEQVALYGVNPDSQPTPRQLIDVIRLAREQQVRAVYFEVAFNDDIARMIAEEVGARTLSLNPGANLTRQELQSGISFFDIMEKNLENLKIGLSCR